MSPLTVPKRFRLQPKSLLPLVTLISMLSIVLQIHAREQAKGGHIVLTQGNGKLAIVDATGEIEWQMDWDGIHDIHVLDNGNILTRQGTAKVVEIDRQTKQVVWSYDSSQENGNEGQAVEVHAFQPLPGGQIMIAESGPARIIEVNRDRKIQHQIKLKIDHPNAHTDTRLARKLDSGNYLVCHEGDGVLREYDVNGSVVWEYEVPLFDKSRKDGHGPDSFGNKLFSAVRLTNGNTLIATGNGHSVLEVNPKKQIVWQLSQNELAGITFAWVTTLEVLPDGHYVIGNCHAGPGQPLLVEIEPASKKVVWTFDQFERFGNSVSNSQLLDVKGSLR
jgi:outer membrane protein assembly factor BamB